MNPASGMNKIRRVLSPQQRTEEVMDGESDVNVAYSPAIRGDMPYRRQKDERTRVETETENGQDDVNQVKSNQKPCCE